jgi:hypothetical protein
MSRLWASGVLAGLSRPASGRDDVRTLVAGRGGQQQGSKFWRVANGFDSSSGVPARKGQVRPSQHDGGSAP